MQGLGFGFGDSTPVPRPGQNDEFDAYILQTFGDIDPSVDEEEIRRAAWRTWRVAAPSAAASTRPSHEDDELARALALSAEEHKANEGLSREAPIVIDDEDDEELQLALQASSAETSQPQRRPAREDTPEEERKMLAEALAASMAEEQNAEIVEDSDDDEYEQANAALQASREAERERQLQERESKRRKLVNKGKSPVRPRQPVPETKPEQTEPKLNAAGPLVGLGLGALGIDRAQLERERLARQAVRSGTESATPVTSNGATCKEPVPTPPTRPAESSTRTTNVKTTRSDHPEFKTQSSGSRLPNHPLQSTGPFPTDAAGEYFLDGELRHVSLRIGGPSKERTFSPRDVFAGTSQMSLLILSSFCWDLEWTESFLPRPDDCPTVRVLRPPASSFIEKKAMEGKLQPLGDGSVHCYPTMDGKSGSEHMKYAWIWYRTGRLRVVIMTCNMVDYDWESIENTVFVQDFLPIGRRLGGAAVQSSSASDFPDQFRLLFQHLKIYKALKFLHAHHPRSSSIPISAAENFEQFSKYDWSRVAVRIVMSIPGTYRGFNMMPTSGICRLGKILAEEGWQPGKNEVVEAEYQGSSLGRYAIDWYNIFYQLCTGKDLQTLSKAGKYLSWPPLKVVFPSLATVDNSIRGRLGGGTMFSGASYSEKTAQLFHDANSKRGGVLMHTKMLIATFEPSSSPLGFSSSANGKRKADDMTNVNEGVGGWVYVGSHNFSPSAWGTVNFKNTPATLNISNYELGIVFPLPRTRTKQVADTVAAHKRPPRPYGKGDVPWSQDKHMPKQ